MGVVMRGLHMRKGAHAMCLWIHGLHSTGTWYDVLDGCPQITFTTQTTILKTFRGNCLEMEFGSSPVSSL